MKTILLCIITSIFFISCSDDSKFETAAIASVKTDGLSSKTKLPANPVNPYDYKGRKFYESLLLYNLEKHWPNSVSEFTALIQFASENVSTKYVSTARLIPFTDEMVQSIMDNPDSSMILIVQNSILPVYAKNNLISFLQNLMSKRQEDFSVLYNYITDYETEVMSDSLFSTDEMETILTVASISRYSLYSAEDRKDRDWETNVGGKPAGLFFKSDEVPTVLIIALLAKMI